MKIILPQIHFNLSFLDKLTFSMTMLFFQVFRLNLTPELISNIFMYKPSTTQLRIRLEYQLCQQGLEYANCFLCRGIKLTLIRAVLICWLVGLLTGFYGISIFVDNLIPNPVNIYVHNIQLASKDSVCGLFFL